MTAHAMKGDRDRCLAAGMDDYLSKPLNVAKLFQTLDELNSVAKAARPCHRVSAAETPGESKSAVAATECQLEACDPERFHYRLALKTTGDDRELLREMIEAFQDDMPRMIGELEQAIEATDAEAIRCVAHRIKGCGVSLRANRMKQAAEELEQAARERDLSRLGELQAVLSEELAALRLLFEGNEAGSLGN